MKNRGVLCHFGIIVLGLWLTGCATPRIMTDPAYQERPALETSLFRGDQDFASEDAVQKILSGRVVLPPKAKVAILKYDGTDADRLAVAYYGYYYWRSEAYIKLQQEFLDTVQSKLLSSGRVSEAAALPSLLVPKQPTISMLRQAGVRLQADLLLVYRVTSDVYYEFHLFTKDEVKAYSTVEAVLLDVRTGIIPFTSIATKDLLTQRLSKEVDREEAMKRAQKDATIMSLLTVCNDLTTFLKKVP